MRHLSPEVQNTSDKKEKKIPSKSNGILSSKIL